MNNQQHITANPDIMLGKPIIRGTRITVELILNKQSDGFSVSDLQEMYPHLEAEAIQSCIVHGK